MTVAELAEQLNVSVGRVRQWQEGKILDPLDVWRISEWHSVEVPSSLVRRDQFLGDKIVDRRIKSGLSRRDLAAKLGVSEHALRTWEEGSMPQTSGMRRLNAWFAEEVPDTLEVNQEDAGRLIDEKRQEWGWTFKRLAEHLGVNEQTVGQWVNGKALPRLSFLNRISVWLAEPVPAVDVPASQTESIELARRVRDKRLRLGITKSDLAKILSVDVASISAWETGRELPDAEVVEHLAVWLSEEPHSPTDDDVEDIASKILQMRLRRGLSQEKLAGILYVSQSAVAQWESGEEIPNDFDMVRVDAWFTGELMARGAGRDENIGSKMKQKRQERGISQAELARLLEVSPTSVGNWEAGSSLPSNLKAARITAWLSEDV